MSHARLTSFALIALLVLTSPLAAADKALGPGDPLPIFVLQDQEGKPRNSETLCADRPLVLSFFARNCASCNWELPVLQQIHADHGEQVRVVVVVLDPEGLAVFAPFGSKYGVSFTVLDGSGGVLQDLLGIDCLPRVLLVGRDGIIRESLLGFSPDQADEFEAKVLGLAGEQ
jgi:thiol-disulfide isomerase/thioredoxin